MDGCFRFFIVIILALFVVSCATVNEDSALFVSFAPYQESLIKYPEEDNGTVVFFDNDANLYSTRWTVADSVKDEFMRVAQSCTDAAGPWFFAKKPVSIYQFKESDLQPTNYKRYVGCIINSGYKFESSEASAPEQYVLDIYRGHTGKGDYLPVGGRMFIKAPNVSYTTMLTKVKGCDKKSRESLGNPVQEQYFDGYIHVSIESYAKGLEACLNQ